MLDTGASISICNHNSWLLYTKYRRISDTGTQISGFNASVETIHELLYIPIINPSTNEPISIPFFVVKSSKYPFLLGNPDLRKLNIILNIFTQPQDPHPIIDKENMYTNENIIKYVFNLYNQQTKTKFHIKLVNKINQIFLIYVAYTTYIIYNCIMKYEIHQCIASRLRRLSRIADSYLRKELIDFGITENQMNILFALNNLGKIEQGAIGKKLVLERSTVSRGVKLLEKQGYIIRTSDYQPKIELTLEGKEIVQKLLPMRENFMDNICNKIGKEGIDELRRPGF